jgi:hypothetical protein
LLVNFPSGAKNPLLAIDLHSLIAVGGLIGLLTAGNYIRNFLDRNLGRTLRLDLLVTVIAG